MDRRKILVPLIGLALAAKNTGDACVSNITNDPAFYLSTPRRIDIFCQINSYNPEHPETKGMMAELPIYTADQVTASGTASSLASLPSIKYS